MKWNQKSYVIFSLLSYGVLAQQLEVVAPMATSDAVVDTPAMVNDTRTIELRASCYGTNLRAVSNPLQKTGKFSMKVYFADADKPVVVQIPNQFALIRAGETASVSIPSSQVSVSVPSGQPAASVTSIQQGLLTLSVPRVQSSSASNVNSPSRIRLVEFVNDRGASLSQSGVSVEYPENNTARIQASFPGAKGSCGGFYSPLMLFKNAKRPDFSATSNFPIAGSTNLKSWPEESSPGLFLVTQSDPSTVELFSGDHIYDNGFESLRRFDTNKDLVVDSRDADFQKLSLWKDRGQMGVLEKGELKTLASEGVVSISLNYSKGATRKVGRAEEREQSSFQFKDKANKIREGQIIDIWFENLEKN